MTKQERKYALIGVAIAAASLFVAVIQTAGPLITVTKSKDDHSSTVNAPQPVVLVTQAPSGYVQDKIAAVFNADLIGSQLNHLESIIGVADSAWADGDITHRTYKDGVCEMQTETDSEQTIRAATLRVSQTCTFDWRKAMINYSYFPPPERMKFGDVMKSQEDVDPSFRAAFSEDCYEGCGNAADPTAELHFGGTHADNWVEIVVGATIAGTDNVNTSAAVAARIKAAKGADYFSNMPSNCRDDVNAIVGQSIAAFRVDYVTLGTPKRSVFSLPVCGGA